MTNSIQFEKYKKSNEAIIEKYLSEVLMKEPDISTETLLKEVAPP